MNEVFNPYREWLGLDSNLQAPDYYQLVGAAPFEPDQARLITAVDKALARVRGFRPGAQAAAWARLLDELAQAKVCFQDPARKAAYDANLRRQSASASQQPAPRDVPTHIAPVNLDPNLYPPGMGPKPQAGDAAISTPNGPPSTARTPDHAPGAPAVPLKPRPVPPPRDTHTQADISAVDDGLDATGGSIVREPVPPGPVNAHVAPPRTPPSSLLPIAALIAGIVVVLTVILLAIALHDDASNTTPSQVAPGTPAPTQPEPTAASPATAPMNTKLPAAAGPAVPNLLPTPPAISSQPGPVSDPPPTVASSQPGSVSDPPSAVTSSQPSPVSDPPPTVASSQPGPVSDPPPAAASSQPSRVSDPPPTVASSQPDSVSRRTSDPALGRLLLQAQLAMAERQFPVAARLLSQAERLATTVEHRAMVQRVRHLGQCAEQFWSLVAKTMPRLQATQELTIGASADRLVIVVETGRDSITIRNQGRNERYTLATMPAGLALAIARSGVDVNDAQNMVLFGACAATVKNRQPQHVAEARRHWEQAKLRGVEVDDLLATLTDNYDR